MKKILLAALICLTFVNSYAQKKSAAKPSAALAKTDNVSAEFVNNTLYIFAAAKTGKDTLTKKRFPDKIVPTDVKITKHTVKGAPLYSVSWKEVNTSESKLRKEVATTTCTEICDVANRKSVLSNAQTTVNITEIRYLDKNQTVSETIDKIRREGMELLMLPDGDVVLKNKGQENRMTYDAAERKYVPVPQKKK